MSKPTLEKGFDTVLHFTKERETKGAVRYTEIAGGDQFVVGTLYIRKSAIQGDVPESLTVTIEFGG